MANKFSELEKKMSPKRLANAKARAKAMMADMLLAEIRKEAGLTQADLLTPNNLHSGRNVKRNII